MPRFLFTGRVVELAIHEQGVRTGVEHRPSAGRPAAAENGGDGRLRWEVGLGSERGPAGSLEDRLGLRLRGSDR